MGVAELIDEIIATDLKDREEKITRHDIPLGTTAEGEEVRLPISDRRVLIAGPSGSGKSTLTTRLMEALSERAYQIAIMDPEGDYGSFDFAVHVGDPNHEPSPDGVMELLSRPSQCVAVNLLAVRLEERPVWFDALLPRIQELRARSGRPHWLVVDEAHHLMPAEGPNAAAVSSAAFDGLVLVTVHPDRIAPEARTELDRLFVTGPAPEEILRSVLGVASVNLSRPPQPGEVTCWSRTAARAWPFVPHPPRGDRLRHRRKYAEGQLGANKSFFFTGPDHALNLRAQNLAMFIQIAEGIDEDTWLHHLRRGDYSHWFEEAIKDPELAAEAAEVEKDEAIDAAESRRRIRAAVERRYTLPASG
jgi:hypothetical protein